MAAKTNKREMTDVLESLGKKNFKKFLKNLCDRRKQPRIRLTDVEDADALDVADVLVSKFTEKGALEVAIEVLTVIDCMDQAQELENILKSSQPPQQQIAPAPAAPAPPAQQATPAPQAPPTQQDQSQQEAPRPVSSELLPSTAEFKANVLQRKRDEIYLPMDKSERTRLALLITNMQFDGSLSQRRGADKDEENMERLLTGLGYQVVKHKNLSAQEMADAVQAFSKREEHGTADSTFVVIMSHGKRGEILGVHWHEAEPESDVFRIDHIFTCLNTANCKALMNKPKVIIIQACQGEADGSVFVTDSASGPSEVVMLPSVEGLEDDSIRRHKEKDFAPMLSCTPDTVSYRDPLNGSLMIQHIVQIFNTYACDKHIDDLFMRVRRRFEDFHRQMPSQDRYTLVKRFYLFPGL